ncbi:hypothetical protein BD626DRAFT_584578 [Schizophyllum amplum]|uniref:Uncharacterized protein n=1 Tax=Schizophyllum amplum TaxID=97359 RepID=A0A550CA10_9AGAR|nr:hypothetical protein BD626DRAFT_584578 [Auriculariopsis ampla]
MTERRHERTSSPHDDSNVVSTLLTDDTVPSVPQADRLANDQSLNVSMPQAVMTSNTLHSNPAAQVAVVGISRRRRLLHAIGAFMRPFSRHASYNAPFTTPAYTSYETSTPDHAQHANNTPMRLSGDLPPQLTLDIDLHQPQALIPSTFWEDTLPQILDKRQSVEVIVSAAYPEQPSLSPLIGPACDREDDKRRQSCSDDVRDRPLPSLPDTSEMNSSNHDVTTVVLSHSISRSDASLPQPMTVSPAAPDNAHVASTGHNLAGLLIARSDTFSFERWEGSLPTGSEGEASTAGAQAWHDENNSGSQRDIVSRHTNNPTPTVDDSAALQMPHDNSDRLVFPSPIRYTIPLPPVEADDDQLDEHGSLLLLRPPVPNCLGLYHLESCPASPQIQSRDLPQWPAPRPQTASQHYRDLTRWSAEGDESGATLPAPRQMPASLRSSGDPNEAQYNSRHDSETVKDSSRLTPGSPIPTSVLAPPLDAPLAAASASAQASPSRIPAAPQSPSSRTTHCDETGDDDTLWAYIGENSISGMYAGLQLVIDVGTKAELRQNASSRPPCRTTLFDVGPFAQAMAQLPGLCSARRHRLTQLCLLIRQTRTPGGQDTMTRVMLCMKDYLRCIYAVTVKMKAENVRTPQSLAEAPIRKYFTRLRYLRIEGKATLARFLLFPLSRLRQLDVCVTMSVSEVSVLVHRAEGLDLLVLDIQGENGQVLDTLQSEDRQIRLPSGVHGQVNNASARELVPLLRKASASTDLRFTTIGYCPASFANLFAPIDIQRSLEMS